MTTLQDFTWVRDNLKNAKKASIVALHKFVFQCNGDRSNRKRLREFTGFSYSENDEAYTGKTVYVNQNLSIADLATICIILGLDHNSKNLTLHIFKNLCEGNLLKDTILNEDNEDESEDHEEDDADNDNINGTVVNKADYNSDECDNSTRSSQISNMRSTEGANPMDKQSTMLTAPRFALNFRDVEDTMHYFDGSGSISVEKWINQFEETASLMYWDDFQRMIFAKKSLKGLAKMFIMSEDIKTWNQLKCALLSEFKCVTNSAQIHKILSERKMKKDESVREYFYNMKEIAARANIESNALIQYVIDGVNDLHVNKAILYGARNFEEFKEKMQNYENFISKKPMNNEGKPFNKKTIDITPKAENKSSIRCFNCGSSGHKSINCTNKSKGAKCFKCNQFGHIAKNCNNVKQDEERNENTKINCVTSTEISMTKNITMANLQLVALFDTGSKLNIITSDVHKRLKKPKLSESHITLSGFGSKRARIRPLGCFNEEIHIDGENFQLEFHVAPNYCMDEDVLIGRSICLQAEVTLNADGVQIHKTDTARIMKIDTKAENDVEAAIEPVADRKAKQKVCNIIKNYTPRRSKTTNIEMKIILTNETPISSPPRRLPFTERKLVEEQIEKWLGEDVIENSDSDFSSPIVLVNKKDGTKRLCVDYRRLNQVIVKDRYPLPLIEDQLDRLSDAKVFSSIDLKNGFFHVAVEEGSRKYTAFVTHNGQYQFKKVPFGLSNSPAVFQRYVNTIFRTLSLKGLALPYIDDVIIPSRSDEEAVNRLEEVMTLCADYGLEINFKKCQFLQRRIEFLGHVIEYQKISPSPGKVEAMMKYPKPGNLKQVESFLGLAGYFRKFIRNFSLIAKPLSDLRKQNTKFSMAEEQERAFENLKRILAEKPVLKIYNEKHVTELHTDASIDGYGAILMQMLPDDGQFHPVYYMSKKTSDAERKYSSYELEILAVIAALKKFRVYLLGVYFKIVTDCDAFAKTMSKRDLSTRVARWYLLLQEFDYQIEHRSGSQMRHVDALSRQPIMIIAESLNLKNMKDAQIKDENLRPIIEILNNGGNYEDYYLKSDILYKLSNEYEKIVIPNTMQYEIIKKAHDRGHFAFKKTKELIHDDYYIPMLDEKIQNCIANCIPCLLLNRKRGKQEGELHPLPKPDTPLHTYHIDFVGPLDTTSKSYKHILVVVDAFSKFCWMYPTKAASAACVISKLILQSVTFGNPVQFITDRGAAFVAEEFKEYCDSEDVKHLKITTGLPRANGQVERINAVVIAVLAKLAVDEPTKWYKYVDVVQQCINSTFSRSTGFTPFELLIGVKMRLKGDIQVKQLIEDEMKLCYNESRDEMRQQAKLQILKTQEENRRTYNLRRKKETMYKEGDYVAIKRTQFGGGLKLKPKYLGPYKIVKCKSNATYDVVKVGSCEGSMRTTTCAEYMKPWPDDVV